MEYRFLGHSGLQVSAVGLGCNTFGRYTDEAGTAAILAKAIDAGINLIDTSNSYGMGDSETHIGKSLNGGARQKLLIGTKGASQMGEGPNMKGAGRQHLMAMLEDSLRRLQTDYIDLYQVHQPDLNTPTEETMRALDDMVRQGKVRYVGNSNYPTWLAAEAMWTSRTQHYVPFISVQPQYNLMDRRIEGDLMVFCQRYGLGILPYFPLAGGFLTGKYRRGEPIPEGTRGAMNPGMIARWSNDRNYDILEKLQKFCAERGRSTADLSIAWLLAKPMVSSVIAGTTRPAQVEANVKSGEWRLTPEEVQEVDKITA
ncbi:MAG: aldo/keto reductase [Dehalococcoidia bacterium]|nr:aldo/keto reductase [Dehalococcoidia bacterium]